MNRIRVGDLAKDLQMSVAELLSTLTDLGVEVKNADSLIDISTAQAVRAVLDKGHPEVELPPTMTVRELAQALGVQSTQIQQKLMKVGVLAGLNQQLSADQIERVAYELGYSVRWTEAKEPEVPESARPRTASTGGPQPRPPVVTILGHVDHGKTTLLDAIRRTNVAEGEYGGITQHIGAYQVEVEHAGEKAKITFLDTPGHEAFTAMRARGAQVTDIAVLVVAADDGVMPQTIEALNHAKAANVPIIVAINKIDKPEANPDRVKQQLAELGVVPEEWGGDTIFVPVSAKQRIGLGDLLEAILLVAEVQELKADPNAPAEGVVIESKLDKGRGPVATIIVQQGTFKQGDAVVAGEAHGKIKALIDDRGNRVPKATPAMPVEVIGLSSVPNAGEKMEVVKDERTARQIAMEREQRHRQEKLASQRARVTMKDLSRLIKEGEIKELLVVLKADVHGSVEAVRTSLERLEHPEVRLRVLHAEHAIECCWGHTQLLFQIRRHGLRLLRAQGQDLSAQLGLEFLWTAHRGELPQVEDCQPIRLVCLFQQMGGEHDGHPSSRLLAEILPQHQPRSRVEACARFVEHQQAWPMQQGLCQLDAAPQAAGERGYQVMCPPCQAEPLQ